MTTTTAPTIPSLAGLLTVGDAFVVDGTATVWTVEELSANPLDEERLTLTVRSGSFVQVLPLHETQAVARVLA